MKNSIAKVFLVAFIFFIAYACSKGPETLLDDRFIDSEGNEYPIGRLCDGKIWMLKNLSISTFRNGDPVPYVFQQDWGNALNDSPASCIYADSLVLKDEYGLLYNWYAVADARGLAPAGWHIPTLEEWQQLVDCNGGNEVAGDRLKEAGTAHWKSGTGNNMSMFNALPGGRRIEIPVDDLGELAIFWTAGTNEECSGITSPFYGIQVGPAVYSNCGYKYIGFSVRCVRNE